MTHMYCHTDITTLRLGHTKRQSGTQTNEIQQVLLEEWVARDDKLCVSPPIHRGPKFSAYVHAPKFNLASVTLKKGYTAYHIN